MLRVRTRSWFAMALAVLGVFAVGGGELLAQTSTFAVPVEISPGHIGNELLGLVAPWMITIMTIGLLLAVGVGLYRLIRRRAAGIR